MAVARTPDAAATVAAAAPAHAHTACLPATAAPWAALARDHADRVVGLAEVMKEQEQQEQEWQHVKQQKRPSAAGALVALSSSELKLYVYHMPASATRSSIIEHFGSDVHINGPHPSSGVAQGKAHCWLTCSDRPEYDRLLRLNNSFMSDHQVRVEAARARHAVVSVAAADAAAPAAPAAPAAHAPAPAAAPAAAAAADDTSKWCTPVDAADQDISQVPPLTAQPNSSFQPTQTRRDLAPFARMMTWAAATPSGCFACADRFSTAPASLSGSNRMLPAPIAASTSKKPPRPSSLRLSETLRSSLTLP